MRLCRRCQEHRSDQEFNANRSAMDGLQDWCRRCESAYREENQERRNEVKRRGYGRDRARVLARVAAWEAANRDWINLRRRARRCGVPACIEDRDRVALLVAEAEAHAEHRRREAKAEQLRRRAARQAELERQRAARKPHARKMTPARRAMIKRMKARRRAERPEEVRAERRAAKQRRRALKAGSTAEPFTRPQLLASYAERGPLQCVYCTGPYESDDHVIPLSQGGEHSIANLVPACMLCNARKGARTPEQWISTPPHTDSPRAPRAPLARTTWGTKIPVFQG